MKKEINQIMQYWKIVSIESLKTAWGKVRDDVKGILKLTFILIIALAGWWILWQIGIISSEPEIEIIRQELKIGLWSLYVLGGLLIIIFIYGFLYIPAKTYFDQKETIGSLQKEIQSINNPRDIKVYAGTTDLGQMTKIAIENNTGYDLTDCYLEIRKITGDLEQDYYQRLPVNCSYIENNKYVANKLAIIPDNKSLQFWVASPSTEKNIGFLVTWKAYNTFKFRNQIKVEYRFFGKSPDGKSKKKDFTVIFQSAGKKTWIEKVRE